MQAQSCSYCCSLFCLTTDRSKQQGCPGSTINKPSRCKQTRATWAADERFPAVLSLLPLGPAGSFGIMALNSWGYLRTSAFFIRVGRFRLGLHPSWKLRVNIFAQSCIKEMCGVCLFFFFFILNAWKEWLNLFSKQATKKKNNQLLLLSAHLQ